MFETCNFYFIFKEYFGKDQDADYYCQLIS